MKKISRADIKAIRSDLTADEISEILSLHHEVVKELDTELQEIKSTHVAKSELETLNEKIATLEKSKMTADELAEFETLKEFKANTEAKAVNEGKINALTMALEKAKANPKMIKLLMKEIDLETVKLNEGNEVEGIDKLIEPLKTSYADCFGVIEEEGKQAGGGGAGGGKAEPTSLEAAIAAEMKSAK